jgi:hypothetical protein
LKQQLAYTDQAVPLVMQTKQGLYNRYGAMLLGYILEVVKTPATAEQFLVDIFNDLQPEDIQAVTRYGVNTFCQLQVIARKKLSSFKATVNECADDDTTVIKGNNFIDMMQPEQQVVFCGMHYHGKSAAKLAAELNKPEGAIRQLLKEAFLIIRSNRK